MVATLKMSMRLALSRSSSVKGGQSRYTASWYSLALMPSPQGGQEMTMSQGAVVLGYCTTHTSARVGSSCRVGQKEGRVEGLR